MNSRFLEKLLAKLDRIDHADLQALVARLLSEKGFFEQVFEALQEGVILLDVNGAVIFINSSACGFFGLEREKAVGIKLPEIVRGFDWQSLTSTNAVLSRDIEITYPERRYLNFYLAPIQSGDKRSGYVMIVNDLTKTREQTQAALESERLGALTLLAAGVAHEIGNPLNSLDIHLQLLERKIKKLSASSQQSLEGNLDTARQEIRRLDGILKQFLQAIRPSMPNRQRSSIIDCLNDTLKMLEAELSSRGVQVLLDEQEHIPLLLLDTTQIGQAFHNLIRNAMQALPSGDDGLISIHATHNDSEVVISIADNGSGISPEMMGVLFEPYQSNKEGGTGLGLLIVRRIIREHGGEIEIESAENHGTRVSLHFPLENSRARLLPEPSDIIEIE